MKKVTEGFEEKVEGESKSKTKGRRMDSRRKKLRKLENQCTKINIWIIGVIERGESEERKLVKN